MPKNGAGQAVISGSKWDQNVATIEGALNGGLDAGNLSASAGIKGSQLATSTVSRSNADGSFELQSIMYWVNL
jgi:hypothetical protein